MKYLVIWNNMVNILTKSHLESVLLMNGITETTGSSTTLNVEGWTRYEGDNGFVCLVYDYEGQERKKHPVYKVIHQYDVDGEFGDAVYEEDVIAICNTKEDAEMIKKAYEKPHAYSKPYSALYCGTIEIEEVKTDTFSQFVLDHHIDDCWWLTNNVIEVRHFDDDDE